MNPFLALIWAVINLFGGGFFTFAALYGKQETKDLQGRVVEVDSKRRYVYFFFSFVTVTSGILFSVEAMRW